MPTGMIWGYQDFEEGGKKLRRYVWFEGKKVGKGFTAFTPDKDGSIIALKDGNYARLYRQGTYNLIAGAPKITISGQERLNAAAGMFDGAIPFGRQIREAALGGPGGVDTESAEYENASTISEGVVQGSLFFTGGPLEGAAKEGAEGAAKVIEEAASVGRRFGPDQEALIQLAKEAKRTGATPEQAKTLIEWAKEYGVKPALDHTSPAYAAHWGGRPHIRIGPKNHIPVRN